MSLPTLRLGSKPSPNIQFIDWEEALMTQASALCQRWSPTGATSVVSSDRAWLEDPRNVLDAMANPITYRARVRYPDPARTDGDTAAQRVIHDRSDRKRDDYLAAVKELRENIITSLGPGLCEAAAAASANGRLLFMSPRDLFEFAEGRFGILTSADVKELVALLATPLTKAENFPTHHAAFARNIRRLQSGQQRVQVSIIPNEHQLYTFMLETVYSLPEFGSSLGLFSLTNADINNQTHERLSAFVTEQLPFILSRSASTQYAGSAAHTGTNTPPLPPPYQHPQGQK
jgi:hypothetical protein